MILVRGLTLLLILLAGWAHAEAPTTIDAGQMVLHESSQLQRTPMSLSGNWHFFPGRWIDSTQLALAAPHSHTAIVPGAWPATDTPAKYGTYWLEILVDNAIHDPSIVYFRHLCGASTVYFFRDGEPASALAHSGRPGLTLASEQPGGGELLATLPPLQPGLYHLLIQQSSFHSRSGGICGAVTIGDTSVQGHAQVLVVIKNTVVATLLLGLALGVLVLGSQDGEKTAPWLALTFTACAVLIACTGGLLDTLLDPANTARAQWRFGLCYIALIWLPSGLLMLFRDTFNVHVPRALGVLTVAAPILLMLLLPLAPGLITPLPKPLIFWLCTQYVLAYGVLFIACRQQRRHAILIALANIPLPFAMAYDYYQYFYNGRLEIFTPYAIAFLIVVHGALYTLKLGAAYQLAARLSTHLQDEVEQRTKELRDKNQKLEQAQTALQRANESLRVLSITDGLTQVHNRMYFEQQFEQEWRRCARQGLSLSVLMIDADHFKKLNDSAGHLIGDLCLRAIAQEIEHHFKRAGELVARYGGEEFIVLLPDTNQNKAVAVAEGLRLAIENLIVEQTEQRYRITISIGVSTTI
ncbi:MAG TPA: diguanylate cyclase, partial [Spongiibacteraceae bacterium]|nr:diguanylate cyclase [Spongiibacteraceae bacterium]